MAPRKGCEDQTKQLRRHVQMAPSTHSSASSNGKCFPTVRTSHNNHGCMLECSRMPPVGTVGTESLCNSVHNMAFHALAAPPTTPGSAVAWTLLEHSKTEYHACSRLTLRGQFAVTRDGKTQTVMYIISYPEPKPRHEQKKFKCRYDTCPPAITRKKCSGLFGPITTPY